jgi:hypothetical protein
VITNEGGFQHIIARERVAVGDPTRRHNGDVQPQAVQHARHTENKAPPGRWGFVLLKGRAANYAISGAAPRTGAGTTAGCATGAAADWACPWLERVSACTK